MLDKDKLIIVVYAGARTPEETYHLIEKLQEHFNGVFDNSVRIIFTPRYNEVGIKFECINPVLLNEEQYKEVNKKIKKLNNTLKEFLKNKDNDEKH